jgi:hypothetical protein
VKLRDLSCRLQRLGRGATSDEVREDQGEVFGEGSAVEARGEGGEGESSVDRGGKRRGGFGWGRAGGGGLEEGGEARVGSGLGEGVAWRSSGGDHDEHHQGQVRDEMAGCWHCFIGSNTWDDS